MGFIGKMILLVPLISFQNSISDYFVTHDFSEAFYCVIAVFLGFEVECKWSNVCKKNRELFAVIFTGCYRPDMISVVGSIQTVVFHRIEVFEFEEHGLSFLIDIQIYSAKIAKNRQLATLLPIRYAASSSTIFCVTAERCPG